MKNELTWGALLHLGCNFCHDAWLKEYGRMASTPECYGVCKELI